MLKPSGLMRVISSCLFLLGGVGRHLRNFKSLFEYDFNDPLTVAPLCITPRFSSAKAVFTAFFRSHVAILFPRKLADLRQNLKTSLSMQNPSVLPRTNKLDEDGTSREFGVEDTWPREQIYPIPKVLLMMISITFPKVGYVIVPWRMPQFSNFLWPTCLQCRSQSQSLFWGYQFASTCLWKQRIATETPPTPSFSGQPESV